MKRIVVVALALAALLMGGWAWDPRAEPGVSANASEVVG